MRPLGVLQSQQTPLCVKPCLVIVAERVAFAGDQKIVLTAQAHLHGSAGFVRGQRGPHRQMPRLGFFATKASAHAPTLHPYSVQRNVQSVGNPVLRFARVLGAAVDQPFAVALGQGVGNLTFQVIVFLAANLQLAM